MQQRKVLPIYTIPMAATDWVQYDLSSEGDQPCGRLHLHRAKHCLYQVSCTWLPGASGVCIGFGNIQHNHPTCLFEDNLPPSPCQSASRTGERPLTSGMDTMSDFECYLICRCSRWLANQCPSVIATSRFSQIINAIITFCGVSEA